MISGLVQNNRGIQIGTAIVLLAAASLYNPIVAAGERSIDSDVLPRAVAGIESAGPIQFDVERSAKGLFHVAWWSREKGIQYLQYDPTSDQAREEHQFGNAPLGAGMRGPRLIREHDIVTLYWRSNGMNRATSIDDGHTWTTGETEMLPRVPIRDFAVAHWRWGTLLAYSNRAGVFLTCISNSDTVPTMTLALGPTADEERVLRSLDLIASDSIWHLTWSTLTTSTATPQIGLYYAQGRLGTDEIQTSHIASVLSGAEIAAPTMSVSNPRLIDQADGPLQIVYDRAGLRVVSSHDGGRTWDVPQAHTQLPVHQLQVAPTPDGTIWISWIDNRFRKREWWGYIPLHEMITWDRDPNWANNDLFLSLWQPAGTLSPPKRLTLESSYTETHLSALKVLARETGVIVFWSGREDVGRTLVDEPAPTKVFFLNIQESSY